MFLVYFKIPRYDEDVDYKPALWPVDHPYWLVSEDEKFFYMRAYVEDFVIFNLLWPHTYDLQSTEVDKVEYTDEFPRPAWYVLKYKYDKLFEGTEDDKLKNLVNNDLIDLLKIIDNNVGFSIKKSKVVIGIEGCDEMEEIEKCMELLDYDNKYKKYSTKEIIALVKEREAMQYIMIVKRFCL